MQRILLAIGGAAAFCAAVTFLLQIAIARGIPATDIVLVTSAATLLLAIGAVAFAYRALSKVTFLTAELERVTRSMDAAIKDVSLRCDRETAKLGDLAATVSERLGRSGASRKHSREHEMVADVESRAAQRTKSASTTDAHQQAAAFDIALRRMIDGGKPDISVQPIIAAGRGEAGGFEVYFHIQPEEEQPVDVRRLDRQVAGVDPAVYERLAVVSATEAARRRLGNISESRPMHVAVSDALLQAGLEFSAVLDIFKLRPSLARSIVLSVPAPLLLGGEYSSALEMLTGLGLRLAAEDWPGTAEDLDLMKRRGVSAVKIPASLLLDQVKPSGSVPRGASLIEMVRGAGLDLIATEVQSEEDAVSLIEMDVDLMSGHRLSAPRRLSS